MSDHLKDHEAETAVLAAWVERPARACESGLDAAAFDHPHLALWASALLALESAGAPVSEETLVQRLRDRGELERAGGRETLAGLALRADPLAIYKDQLARVRDRAIRRGATEKVRALLAALRDTTRPGAEIVQTEGEALLSLASDGQDDPNHIAEVTAQVENDRKAAKRGEAASFLPSGIPILDKQLGGWACGQLIVLGAQPRIGKSAVMLTSALEVAGKRVPTLIFSLEDPADWVARRGLALYSRTSIRGIRMGQLSEYQEGRVEEEARRISGLPLWIHDAEGVTARKAVAIARKMVRWHGVRLVLVDHLLELVPDGGESRLARDERIGEAVAALRDLAKNTRTPRGEPISVVLAAHLRRPQGDEAPQHRKPHLCDFAGSAFVERRARVAVGLYRPKPTMPDPGPEATPDEREAYAAALELSERTILATILKQTEGREGGDFAMQLYSPAGAVDPRLGWALADGPAFSRPYPEAA